MPNPSSIKGGKLPRAKARVVYVNADEMRELNFTASLHPDPSSDRNWTQPVAILPCATKAQAARICKAHNMTETGRAAFALNEFYRNPGEPLVKMLAALSALGLVGEATR